jgi:hypothetical protein
MAYRQPSTAGASRACSVLRPLLRGLSLFLLLLVPHIATNADGQSVAGEPGAGIPESGSLSLANALAAVALDPSTGVLLSSLPIETPAARGAPQMGLALTYNSAAGIREAGVGWGLSVPTIERQNRDGLPWYEKAPANQTADRFVFNGSALVAICVVEVKGPLTCRDPSGHAVRSEPLPGWVSGWTYYRLETDTSRARFFLAPDERTWRVQFVGGEILELGVPLVRSGLTGGRADDAIDYETIRTGTLPVTRHALRWNAVRRFDGHAESGFR